MHACMGTQHRDALMTKQIKTANKIIFAGIVSHAKVSNNMPKV